MDNTSAFGRLGDAFFKLLADSLLAGTLVAYAQWSENWLAWVVALTGLCMLSLVARREINSVRQAFGLRSEPEAPIWQTLLSIFVVVYLCTMISKAILAFTS